MKNILLLLALIFVSVSIYGQDDGITIPATADYEYDAARTNFLAVNYVAFHSTDADEHSFVFNTSGQPYKFFRGGNGNFGYASAPIYLPDGVVITKMTAYTYDNSSTEFLRLRILETPYGGSNSLVANVETTGAFQSTDVQELESGALNITIDNSLKSYQLRFSSSNSNTSDIRLYGVKIEYTTLRAQ